MPFDNFSPTNIGAATFLILVILLHSRTVGELDFGDATVGVGTTVVVVVVVGVAATVGVGLEAGGTVAVVVKDIESLPAVSCIAELEVAEFGVGAV